MICSTLGAITTNKWENLKLPKYSFVFIFAQSVENWKENYLSKKTGSTDDPNELNLSKVTQRLPACV